MGNKRCLSECPWDKDTQFVPCLVECQEARVACLEIRAEQAASFLSTDFSLRSNTTFVEDEQFK